MNMTSLTKPVASDQNSNHVVDRRAASKKQRDTVRPGKWPLLTRAAYLRVVQGDSGLVGDKRLKRLAAAKAALGHAVLMVDAAAKGYNPQVLRNGTPDEQADLAPIHNALRAQHEAVQKLFLAFPLEVGD